ncbi:MAG: UDP-N-acetylglucosamine 1-carboxyvinyltransferase [Candidatus Latescibacteria bacterium]|nr:UDP-N-acetylglucosamine 1-carboxyvinyltransferase [Candidatus Latescibacterota bacterium]NIM22583.1 UDP-N-acetylglucosamine 1-carboxyvinyltransferase [Candidatus Latescibacterota bacterium]NIM64872.1 UDP-N-acetylglucosamine 1-carboxyvinyltransferase [Candidatus Latescibacterota bacterium]NIO01387.1 UDP-N-acetylglucosamine 1-carboxyvinyltransferase [Candidatus Latescibacterota bacterium]NIO27897.1 UDP-N-acetylglucosamine 1-carboxyvinyltransferase [Candidatus Latescibacterota bacterium]
MDKFIIQGPRRLQGDVEISGAKNAVLPLMAASLLARGESAIENVPDLRDVRTMIKLLRILGAEASLDGSVLSINTKSANGIEAPYDLVRTMRASIYVLGSLLATHGKARVSLPGGCAWGPRPIDLHLMAIERLGARVKLDHGYIYASSKRLKGTEIAFPVSSVGATANAMMAASLARGTTVIRNAALEPEVSELAKALVSGGVAIDGIGTSTLTIEGTQSLNPFRHRVIPDRIEAGTYAAAAVITGGSVRLHRCDPSHMEAVFNALKASGAEIKIENESVLVEGPKRAEPGHIVTREYPGFPTDMQAQIMAVLCRAKGFSTIKDTIYPDRFTHVPELRRFGADIRLDGNLAVINGVPSFQGAPVMATDIRASSALILAGLVAEGTTEVLRVYHIDRGYDRIVEKLRGLGAEIQRVSD